MQFLHVFPGQCRPGPSLPCGSPPLSLASMYVVPGEAAAAGDRPRVDELLAADPPPAAADIDEAFWQACHGGQRTMAEYLLGHGASISATPGNSDSTPLQAAAEVDTWHQALVDWLRGHGAAGA